ncbi:FUSC family protein [Nocardioides panacis]|uniref:FUSC family protein n=1 Tax=Nocardioides panacis TaxID=2849501 RepID=A0A975Y1Y5_9ACTN|nr:FUSC family protein [Nocardioides panacis]QWZ09995.1 FUSC family protein [Nocardioides panacis]
MHEWWRRGLSRELSRLRGGGRAAVLWSLRITVAAVASYVVATWFFPGTQPLLAPLTSMLVVQVTPVSLLASGVDRVVAVVAGVSVAVAFATVVPLEWWSLGLLILVSITIGQALHLRANLVEVAISGMLVLGVGSFGADAAAWQRLAETLVGAAVGIAATLVFPRKVASADAGRAIDGLADALSELLHRAAAEVSDVVRDGRELAPYARSWLDEARRITHEDIPRVGAALLLAEQGRRFNVRAVGTADAGPGLRQGLEALEHSAVSIRGMFRALVDAAPADAAWLDDESAEDVLLALAQTFREMGAGVDAFGQLVRDEADDTKRMTSAHVHTLRQALDGLHEASARLDDMLTSAADPDLIELVAAVRSAVKRLLGEMDLGERIRRQVRLVRRTRTRLPTPGRPAPEGRPPATEEPSDDAETHVLPAVHDDRRDRRRR